MQAQLVTQGGELVLKVQLPAAPPLSPGAQRILTFLKDPGAALENYPLRALLQDFPALTPAETTCITLELAKTCTKTELEASLKLIETAFTSMSSVASQ